MLEWKYKTPKPTGARRRCRHRVIPENVDSTTRTWIVKSCHNLNKCSKTKGELKERKYEWINRNNDGELGAEGMVAFLGKSRGGNSSAW